MKIRKSISYILSAALLVNYFACDFSSVKVIKADENDMYIDVRGDINGNGVIDIQDIMQLKKWILGDPEAEIYDLSRCDINENGVINVLDLSLLKKALLDCNDTPGNNDNNDDNQNHDTENEGNSEAFSYSPLDGLTVSAEENALNYDGQLSFSELDDDEGMQLSDMTDENGCLLIEGYHANAGLQPDEHLPGSVRYEYNLSDTGIPEEVYDNISVFRIDDAGNWYEYELNFDGSVMSWNCDQNSIQIILIAGAVALAGTFTYKLWSDYDVRAQSWTEDEKKCITAFPSYNCTVYYADDEYRDEREARIERMLNAEKTALEEAKKRAEELVIDEWNSWGALSFAYRREINRRAAAIQKEILDENEEYQEDLEKSSGVPADVRLAAYQYSMAHSYLRENEGCPSAGYKTDIILTSGITTEGYSEERFIGNPYLVIKRNSNADPRPLPKNTEYNECYEAVKGRHIDADDVLITMTHELYHNMQSKKLSSSVLSENMKFMEMSAICVEHRCASYYLEQGIMEKYTDAISNRYETFSIPIDSSLFYSSDKVRSEGYALANYWEFIEEHKGRVSGWNMITAFKKYGSILETINKVFDFPVMDGDENALAGAYWKAYQKANTEKFMARGKSFASPGRDDKEDWFPSLVKRLVCTDCERSGYFEIPAEPLTSNYTYINGVPDRPWTAVIVPDENYAELQPDHEFLIYNDNGESVSSETKSGIAFNSEEENFFFRECTGSISSGTSGYQIYVIPAPDSPEVTDDAESRQLTVRLVSEPGIESFSGVTDRFMLTVKVNENDVLELPVNFENWNEEIVIPYSEINLSEDMTNVVEISVCELIEAGCSVSGNECDPYRTQKSAPAVILVEADKNILVTDSELTVSYGKIGNCSIPCGSGNVKAHFNTDENGMFTWSIESGTYGSGFTGEFNPFITEDEGYYAGFYVTGNIPENADPNDWTADISMCEPNYFYISYSWQAVMLSDDGESGIMTHESSGSFEDSVTGTLHFRAADDGYEVTLTLNPVITCRFTGDDSEEIKEEESVVFVGSLKTY